MAITFIITNAGRNALVNAANTGTAPVTIAQAGLSGSALAPAPWMNALPGEFKRIGTLSGDVVADDTIHLIVRDESSDVFTLRSIALYLADGTLFGIYGQADVLLEKSSQALMLLAVDIRFEDVAAANIAFGNANFLNPPATTERQGVVELATAAEARAGNDAVRAVTPATGKSAVIDWLGFTPVRQGTGFGQGPSTIHVGWSGLRLKATVDSSDLGNILFDNHVADVWRSSNDGAGSGLDADMLDGSQGSYYTDIPARLGYSPVQQGTGIGQSAYSVVKIGWSAHSRLRATVDNVDLGNIVFDGHVSDVWRSSNDGAGSGLDADLLDGSQGSYYTDIPARLGYSPVQQGTGIGQMPNVVKIGWSGHARLRATIDNVDLGNIVFDDHVSDVWRANNDGAGSGLDADLLDGSHGSYYTNIPARLGFTPIQQGTGIGQSATQVIKIGWSGDSRLRATVDNLDLGNIVFDTHVSDVWRANNDGAGSGLDADLLDGSHGSYYTNIPARLGFTPIQQGTGIGQSTAQVVKIGWSGDSRLRATVDNDDQGNFVFDVHVADVWRSSNDGAGSGLDADLLDGSQGSYYTNIPARLGFTPIQQGTGIGQSAAQIVKIGWSGDSRLRATVDNDDQGNFVFDVHVADVWRSSNDGAGSGLDADLLDGSQGSYYTDIPARLGYTPVQQGTGIGQSSAHVVAIGWSGDSRLRATVDDEDQGNIVFDAHVSDVWRSSNDGAGSGLDADMLDGQQGSYFTDIAGRLGFTPIQQGTGVGQSPAHVVKIGWNTDNRLRATVDAVDLGKIVFDGHVVDVWRSSNDGAGSGLDADLLDGQQGSYYANIPARLGFNPVRQGTGVGQLPNNIVHIGWSGTRLKTTIDANDKGAIVLEDELGGGGLYVNGGFMRRGGFDLFGPENDGSGSGLDADLLDGQQGSYYANIPARLGFNPVRQGTGVGQLPNNIIHIGWSGTRLKATVDAIDKGAMVLEEELGGGSFYINGAYMRRGGFDLFGPENDGSGSGLDADLLDGLHASDFLRDVGHSFEETGYMRLSNGLILQWGTIAGTWGANVNIDVVYPINFPARTLTVVGTNSDVNAQFDAVVGINYTNPAPTSGGFNFRTNRAGQNRLNWIAIGV